MPKSPLREEKPSIIRGVLQQVYCVHVNYGGRYRNGERISTGFVESTINQGGEQANGQEAADAVDAQGCPFAASGPDAGSQRGLGGSSAQVASRLSGSEKASDRDVSSGLTPRLLRALGRLPTGPAG